MEPLFSAVDFHRYVANRRKTPSPRLPRNIVVVFGSRWEKYLGRRYRGAYDPLTGVFRANRTVGVAWQTGPGSPYSAIVIEELSALDANRFLIVGMAGSLQSGPPIGSFVVCTKALRDEGTSHHYARPTPFAYPDAGLTRALKAMLRRKGIPFAEGPTWTTDAPYRETRAEIRRYRSMGILTVEMEASAVFSVARHLGRKAAALFVVSDHLSEEGWQPRFHETRTPLRQALDVAVSTLASQRLLQGRQASRLRP
ncbi:MAG TPA: nucleoside phosphorylase [Thermoplasmata archaeon]|nr:nucleoside phosphorylase [Thermoplasmata archaeon]